MKIRDIAIICHKANKALCEALGDKSQVRWGKAEKWQQESAINGVAFHIKNPDAKASASHEAWLAEKEATGWVYGGVKDPEAKTHPCMVPFEELPPGQQAKDVLFKGVVEALRPLLEEEQ